jgi:S1-C subfamily serine protease
MKDINNQPEQADNIVVNENQSQNDPAIEAGKLNSTDNVEIDDEVSHYQPQYFPYQRVMQNGLPYYSPQTNLSQWIDEPEVATLPEAATTPKAKKKSNNPLNHIMLAIAIFLSAGTGYVAANSLNNNNTASIASVSATAASTSLNTESLDSITNSQMTVGQVADLVSPAVVQITTSVNSTSQFEGSTQATGVGSGIIYDTTGYILTNYHVVEGASSLTVALTDGRTFDGTVVGSDSKTDLAVVKIEANGANLPVAVLGDSNALKVGDQLVAIGNALALPGGPTVTTGIVSALSRTVTEPSTQTTSSRYTASSAGTELTGLIQTDAAINPGNSGGPLINMQGEVVGINTLGAGQVEPGVQAQGIGFAISINQAKTIAQQIVSSIK